MTRTTNNNDAGPYSIELVPVDRGWIIEKIAGEIAREAATSPERYQVTVTTHPTGNAELTFFLPESAWRDDLEGSIRVTYLAHKEDHPEAAALFEEVARKSDYCVTSSFKYAEVLRNDGAREVFTIPLGVDTDIFVPKVRIGVVGRTYHTGRKGESLLARSMDLPYVEFVFTGEGWPLPAHYYGERDMVELFQSLDYLLIPSLIEGGPVPMLEALSAGCRVIAPTDVGMVSDFPHLAFRRGDPDDLRRVIRAELEQRLTLRTAALSCDWRHFARRHLDLFAQLIDRKRGEDADVSASPPPRIRAARRCCRALLVTHGSEGTSRGGPTTRVHNIVAQLRARGVPVDAGDGPHAIAGDRYDVVHVFNIWPPDSALATLVAARRSGAVVVFSPIALDLTDWPIFHPLMEKLFHSAPDNAQLLATLTEIRAASPPRTYAGVNAEVPIEGLPGLFDKLRLCCDLADHLVFLSEYEREFLAAIGARIDHGVLIRNGVDVDEMAGADPEVFRRHFGFDRYLLCVGRLEYRKNQALAALSVRDTGATLVLVGTAGDAGYADHIRRLGGRNIRVLERIEDRQLLASAYAGADAFLFPSWTEGAPLAAMEAGAAGTPLVLSEMSSEREYFGDDAVYVHPADIGGIRAAVIRLLEQPDTTAQRQGRSRRLAGAFSIKRHADETWALYERVHANRLSVRTSAPIVMDLSALLHFRRTREPFTGVPMVEWNLLRELAKRVPTLRCIVYNDVKGRFIEIGIDDLKDFDEGSFNARHWFSVDEPHGVDRCATLYFADHSTPAPPNAMPALQVSSRTFRTMTVVMSKRVLQRVPRAVGDPAIALLQRLRPGFDPFQMPQEHRAIRSTPGLAPQAEAFVYKPLFDGSSSGAVRRFEHSLGTLVVRDTSRHKSVVPVGARLLTLGQSWLSNQPLLDEMVHLTETRALSLEPYVYDLTYHTGAHLTGWADNNDRLSRLLTLLHHSRRVYTASRQVENELQKLRASRGLAYSTCRTTLRGRDMAHADARAAPTYEPESYVLVVSSFNRRKNHDFLVHVWRDLYETWISPATRPFRLVLAGQIQEERKYQDPAFLAHLSRSNIDVHTDLSDGALAHMMRECAFTAYPSLQEGWGLPVQESLICGKVCLVSDSLPVAQEITNPALIRIAPNDFYGWHEALRTWLDNTPMRQVFSEVARGYAPQSWSEITAPIHQG